MPGGKLKARFLTEDEYGAWTELVSRSPAGSVYSTPEYLDALCSAAGGRFRMLACERGGELAGGIALYETETFWGRKCTGRLLLYYNGIIEKPHVSKYPSEQTSRHNDLLSAIEPELAASRFGRIQIRNRHPFTDARVFLSRGWQVIPSYSYEVPIHNLSAAWERMEQNLRRLVRRAETANVTLSEDDDFSSFFRLHEQTHLRKKVSLYLPRAAFEQYFQRLRSQGLCWLFHARLPDGRAVSSQLVLGGPHPVSHTVAAAFDADYMQLGATAFLRWKVFERLCRMGYEANDLTDATLNPVTHFKSQLGGDLKTNLVLVHPDSVRYRTQATLENTNVAARRIVKQMLSPILNRKGR